MATRTIQAMIVDEDFYEDEACYGIEIDLAGVHDDHFEQIENVKVVDAHVWDGRIFIELTTVGTPAPKYGRTMQEYLG